MRETITRGYRRHRALGKSASGNGYRARRRDTRVTHYACELLRIRRTREGEIGRDRSYRRYNTFVSRGDTPRQGSIRCERAASTDRALRREHMAARVDSHHFPLPLTIVRRGTASRHKRVYVEL